MAEILTRCRAKLDRQTCLAAVILQTVAVILQAAQFIAPLVIRQHIYDESNGSPPSARLATATAAIWLAAT